MTSWSTRFRRGAARAELRMPFCPRCDAVIWYPRSACPVCLSTELDERTVAGTGTVRSWAVVHRSQVESLQPDTPFGIGLVELDEGATMIARLDDGVRTGERVAARFDDVGGRALPVFARLSAAYDDERGDSAE